MKNKMWQRLTSLLLVVCMVFGMSINAWARVQEPKPPKEPEKKYSITIDEELTDKVYGPENAKEGHLVVLAIKGGHDIEGLIVMCEDGTVISPKLEDKGPDKGKYTFKMPASNVTVTVEKDVQEPVTYTITVNTSENGAVEVNKTKAEEGDTVELTVEPADDYELEALSVTDENGDEVEVTANYTFTMPASDVTVTASFKEVKQEPAVPVYKILVKPSENGTVTADKTEATAGETVTLNVSPDAGCELETLTVTDASGKDVKVTDNSFTMPASKVTVTASFKKVNYTITVNNLSGVETGTVTAPANAKAGDTVTLNVTPDAGYELETLTVVDATGKEVEVEVTANYTFTMPASNVTVTASFTKISNPQTVNVVIYRNGNLDKAYKTVGLEKVEKGETLNVSALDINNYYSSANGFEFDGFFNDGGFNSYKKNGSATPLSEIKINGWTNLIAVVTDYEKVVVKAVTNGDTDNAESIHSGKALRGSLLNEYLSKVTVPEKTGYTMDKWYKWDSPKYKFGENDTVNGWTNVRVNYTANNYTVEFNGNGATSGEMADMDFTYDEAQNLTANAFTRVENDGKDQFKFIGWSTSADGKAVYTDGQSVSNLTAEANGVVTLYAQWEQISTGSTPIGDVTAARYVVEYYKQDSNGQYVKDEAETFMSDAVAIGTEVTAEQKEFGGYKLNEGKSELSGIVSFNSQAEVPFLTLKVYYDALTDVTITVEWDDDNNRDGLRVVDKDVIVELLTNGKKASGKKVKLSASEESDSATFSMLKFDNGNEIAYSVNDVNGKSIHNLPDGYTVEVSNEGNEWTVVLKHEPARMDMDVTVVWDDEDNRDGFRPSDMKLELVKNKYKQGDKKIPITTEDNKTYTYENLYVYENGEEINYSVVGAFRPANYSETVTGNMEDGYTVTLKHTPETIDISGTINWDDHSNNDGFRPESVTVNLNGGDVSKTVEVNSTDSDVWNYTFEDVYKYYNGEEIEYVVSQNQLSNNYITNVNGFKITNSRPLDTVNNVRVTLFWDDDNDRDGKRPEANEVTVNLLGKPLYVPVLFRWIPGDTWIADSNAPAVNGNTWTYNFDLTDVNGNNKYFDKDDVLFIAELADKKALKDLGYDIIVSNDGKTITLKHIPEEVSFSGEIEWIDDNDRDGIRPENYVTVKLYKVTTDSYGREWETNVHTVTTGKNSNTEYSFASNNNVTLYKYENGEEIKYVAKVVSVDGYTSESSDPEKVSATHVPETIDISGTVTWKDGSDYDNIRPDNVVIKLIGDDKEYEETFNSMAGNVWEYEFAGVHKYLNGKEIEYSVSQNKVPGYTTTIKNFDITNIHSPNYPEIEDEPEEKVVVKVKWFNDDSSYRPEEVTVQLYKDGRKYRAAAELSADKDTYENWRYVWEDVNEDEDTEWSIKVNGIPSEYIYEIEQVRSSYFVVNCTLNENEVKKNPETGAF